MKSLSLSLSIGPAICASSPLTIARVVIRHDQPVPHPRISFLSSSFLHLLMLLTRVLSQVHGSRAVIMGGRVERTDVGREGQQNSRRRAVTMSEGLAQGNSALPSLLPQQSIGTPVSGSGGSQPRIGAAMDGRPRTASMSAAGHQQRQRDAIRPTTAPGQRQLLQQHQLPHRHGHDTKLSHVPVRSASLPAPMTWTCDVCT